MNSFLADNGQFYKQQQLFMRFNCLDTKLMRKFYNYK